MLEKIALIIEALITVATGLVILLVFFTILGAIIAAAITVYFNTDRDITFYTCLAIANGIPLLAFIKGIKDGC